MRRRECCDSTCTLWPSLLTSADKHVAYGVSLDEDSFIEFEMIATCRAVSMKNSCNDHASTMGSSMLSDGLPEPRGRR